jgi:hypothetical protein
MTLDMMMKTGFEKIRINVRFDTENKRINFIEFLLRHFHNQSNGFLQESISHKLLIL